MADLSVTATSVIPSARAIRDSEHQAGETVTAGVIVYLKASDNKWWKADANLSVFASVDGAQIGIAENGGGAGQRITVVLDDPALALGSILTEGTAYAVSATAGLIAPIADITTADNLVLLGGATSATTLRFRPLVTGGTVA